MSRASNAVDSLTRIRSFAKAGPPNEDVSKVRGNCSDEQKQLNMNALAFYAGGGTSVYGSAQAKNLKLVEANLRSRQVGPSDASDPYGYVAETVFEIEVEKGAADRVTAAILVSDPL